MAVHAFSEEERTTFHHERFYYPDPRVQLKMEVLWFLSQGLELEEAARLADVSVKTVRRYLRQYLQGGLEALKHNHYAKPTSELDNHSESLKKYFEENPPVSIKQAQDAIERLTGLRRSESQVRKFLIRLGMKFRKMGSVPGKVDEPKMKEQREFLDTKLQPRLDEATAGNRQLFFVDASHFVHGAFLCCVWCFIRVFLKTPSGRKRFNVLGALNFTSKQLHTVCNTGYITATTVCELLQQLAAAHPGELITVVLDNAAYQRCALVQALAVSLGIELLFLPSYSPNLNLIERLWKFVKKECLYGKYYETFDAFKGSIEDCLSKTTTKHRDALATLITGNFQLFDKEQLLAA
jgi:transposase